MGLLCVILLPITSVVSEIDPTTASFSAGIESDTTYSWNIENYQIGDRLVEIKTSSTAFEFVHGSRIDLTILQNPATLDLSSRSSISNAADFDDYFVLQYDTISYDFEIADLLYIWIFPVSAIDKAGNSINLITEFWIYNLYNLLLNGETLEFNSTLPTSEITSEIKEDEITVNFDNGDSTIQARVDRSTGLLNTLNFVSFTPDFRIEIDRRGGGSALPNSPFPVLAALIAIPLLERKFRH